jgi:N-acyl homoserine lactone hydrolase
MRRAVRGNSCGTADRILAETARIYVFKFPSVLAIALASALLAGAVPRAQSSTGAASSIRMYVIDGGIMKARDGVPYGLSLEQLPPRDLANYCVLVVHPRGTLLWDTGLNASVNDTPPGSQSTPGAPRAGDRVDRPLTAQLEAIGHPPASITHLALSHSHWDHTGNVRSFLGSTWLVQKAERDLMFGERPLSNRADFAGLENSRTEVLEGDHDVFGDGSVRLLSTPGHTPGHQALLVRLPKTGSVLLSGDLYHFPEELTIRPTPTGRNAAQIVASMAKVQALMAKTGAALWIQHDILGYAQLRRAPAFYD